MELTKLTTRDNIGLVLNSMVARTGAEIGVAFGQNAEVIPRTSHLKRLFVVDPWDYVPNEDPTGYADAIKDWKGCQAYCEKLLFQFGSRAVFKPTTSELASLQIPDASLDFVNIDAYHMRPMIDRDLDLWWPKVREGGIFGGHDYHMVNRPDYCCEVKVAVDEFFAGKGYTLHATKDSDPSWYVIK